MLLRTLGGLSLSGARFNRPKPLLLLAYLVLEGPQDRRYLAELFWPDAADSRQSLTVALSQLRAAAPSLVRSEWSRVSAEVDCDALQLREALANHDWDLVAQLYEGKFLAGVDIGSRNLELEEWLYATREMLALSAQTALVELAERALADGDVPTAGRLAERAVTLAPDGGGDAPRMERLLALLAATDSPRLGALREEAEAFGVSLPEPPPQPGYVALQSLPADLTPFVGREDELRSLFGLLEGDARLVTITGLGGIGKTRLAVELARRLAGAGRYSQVHFVPLRGGPTDDQFAALLSAMLSKRNRGRRATDKAGGDEAAGASLLVLDDFDPTASPPEQIEALLSKMPALDVIVTARQPLGSVAETQFQLAGLALGRPGPGAEAPSDALDLYVQTARRYDPTFELHAADDASVHSICELVAGSPLGIELAAALSRLLSTSELLSELRNTLDVLGEGQGGTADGYPTVRAIFDNSWSRLGAAERMALAGCAIFRGGFTRTAAARVLGLDVRLLTALLERSLIRRQGNRFELHPLVQQYAAEKLEAYAEADTWRELHAAHYTSWFASKRTFVQRSGQRQALEELAPDFPNLAAAWQWAADAARTDLLEQAIFMTARFLLLRGRTTELKRLLQIADGVAAKDSLLHARVLRWQAAMMDWDDPVGAERLLVEALSIHEALGREDDLGPLYYHLGFAHAFRGDAEAARSSWRDAIALLERHDEEELLGSAYSSLSQVMALATDLEELASRAHAICVERGTTAQLALCLACEAGEAHYAYGDSATAIACQEEAIALEETEGGRDDLLLRYYCLQTLELVNIGELERAEERLKAAYRLSSEHEMRTYLSQGLSPIEFTAAHLHDARGEFAAARAVAERVPTDRLCRETLCRLALQAGDIVLAEKHLAVLGTLRGYGFTVRVRLHERAVEQLFRGELARAKSLAATAAGDAATAERQRAAALEALGSALDDAVVYTFLPLALETFTAAHALDPSLCPAAALALAARHAASRYYVRRRAGAMLPPELPPATEALVAGWLEVPPTELVPVVTGLAEEVGAKLAAAIRA